MRWLDSYHVLLDAILLQQGVQYRRLQFLIARICWTARGRREEQSAHRLVLQQALKAHEDSVHSLLESLFALLTVYVRQSPLEKKEGQDRQRVGSLMLILLLQSEEWLGVQTRKRQVIKLWEDPLGEAQIIHPDGRQSFRLAVEKLRAQLAMHSPFSKSVTQSARETLRRMQRDQTVETAFSQTSLSSQRHAEEPWLNAGVAPGGQRKKRTKRKTKKEWEETME